MLSKASSFCRFFGHGHIVLALLRQRRCGRGRARCASRGGWTVVAWSMSGPTVVSSPSWRDAATRRQESLHLSRFPDLRSASGESLQETLV